MYASCGCEPTSAKKLTECQNKLLKRSQKIGIISKNLDFLKQSHKYSKGFFRVSGAQRAWLSPRTASLWRGALTCRTTALISNNFQRELLRRSSLLHEEDVILGHAQHKSSDATNQSSHAHLFHLHVLVFDLTANYIAQQVGWTWQQSSQGCRQQNSEFNNISSHVVHLQSPCDGTWPSVAFCHTRIPYTITQSLLESCRQDPIPQDHCYDHSTRLYQLQAGPCTAFWTRAMLIYAEETLNIHR